MSSRKFVNKTPKSLSRKRFTRRRTTLIDAFFLVTLIVLLPLQSDIPTLGGASITFLVTGLAALYLFVFRFNLILKIYKHPVFLSGFLFAGTSILMEFIHQSNRYSTGIRIGFMVIGALIVATLCRDRKALQVVVYGYCLSGVIVSTMLIISVYGNLTLASGENFEEASRARVDAFSRSDLENDINLLGFHCAQGVIAALVLGLTAQTTVRKQFFFALGILMMVATFLPMSRGAIAILIISCVAVAYSYGMLRPKVVLAFGALLLAMVLLVPAVAFKRFQVSFSENKTNEQPEIRKQLILAAIEEFPQYIIAGVGERDFYGAWGQSTKFYNPREGRVVGPHNCFVITMVFWGLPGILSLLIMIWNTYRVFPKYSKGDRLGIFLLGISMATLLEACVVQTLAAKEFSLTLGLIVGSSFWVWKNRRRVMQINLKPPLLSKSMSARTT